MEKQIQDERTTLLHDLKATFPSLFKRAVDASTPPIHDVKMEIVTMGYYKRPFPYRPPEVYYEQVKKRIDEMIDEGVLSVSSSPYSSPMVCVPKKDGTLRLCTDFRNLNDITVPDRYVMPRSDEIKRSIKGFVFSTIDLKEGFNQVPITEHDIPKTAMATPWGLYEYTRMPFGLKNAPTVFQRYISFVLHGLSNTAAYIDDIIIYSQDVSSHKQHLYLSLIHI